MKKMKAAILTSLLFACFYCAIAQDVQFQKRPDPSLFYPVYGTLPPLQNSDFSVGDVNGDGNEDLVMIGSELFTGTYFNTYLLLGNGTGQFYPAHRECIPPITRGACELFDADLDGDLDLLLVGLGENYDTAAYYFRNDGSAGFTQDTASEFVGLYDCISAIGDINGDKVPDVVLSGRISNASYNTRLDIYLGDSTGHYSRVSNTLTGVYDGDIALRDLDGDTDLDLFVSGSASGLSNYTSDLYLNDGLGNFTTHSSGIAGFDECGFAFGDLDGDLDLDLAITGDTAFAGRAGLIYLNNGSAYFTVDTTFNGVKEGSVAIGDIDGDTHLDIFYSGQISSSQFNQVIYNDGLGNYNYTSTNALAIKEGKVELVDLDKNFFPELIVSGFHSANGVGQASEIYVNDGFGNLQGTQSHFDATERGHMDVADIDGDGDLDFISTGSLGYPNPSQTQLFLNNGNGDFTEVMNHGIMNLDGGVAFIDADGDLDQDVIISGKQYSFDENAKLYLNNGSGSFSFSADLLTDGADKSYIEVGDVDGDGDEDFIISGEGPGSQGFPAFTRVYKSNGSGVFNLDNRSSIVGVKDGKLLLVDIDNDQDLDLFVIGSSEAKLYLNDSTGLFTLSANNFRGIRTGDIDVADIDQDGDLDFMYLGDTTGATSTGITRLYLNDSTGNFTRDTANVFRRFVAGRIRFDDYDGDGAPDLLLIGATPHDEYANLYINDGTGKFFVDPMTDLEYAYNPKVEFFDIDADSDLDFVYHGFSGDQRRNIGYVYENTQCQNILIGDIRAECGEYTWGKSGCTYYESGIYTFRGVDPFGCDTIYTLDLSITPSPTISWLNDSTLISDTIGSNYQWLRCDSNFFAVPGANNSSYIPTENGDYALVLTNGLCTDTSNCISVRGIGFSELSYDQWQIYPQPTSDILMVQGLNMSVTYHIYDLNGRLLQSGNIAGKERIPLNLEQSGVYFIQLLDGNELLFQDKVLFLR